MALTACASSSTRTPESLCDAQVSRAEVELKKYEALSPRARDEAAELLAQAKAQRQGADFPACRKLAQEAIMVLQKSDTFGY
jgi:hypothetical protein